MHPCSSWYKFHFEKVVVTYKVAPMMTGRAL